MDNECSLHKLRLFADSASLAPNPAAVSLHLLGLEKVFLSVLSGHLVCDVVNNILTVLDQLVERLVPVFVVGTLQQFENNLDNRKMRQKEIRNCEQSAELACCNQRKRPRPVNLALSKTPIVDFSNFLFSDKVSFFQFGIQEPNINKTPIQFWDCLWCLEHMVRTVSVATGGGGRTILNTAEHGTFRFALHQKMGGALHLPAAACQTNFSSSAPNICRKRT